ncbi:unnamed protein product, partial [Dovyalis caffra]
IKAPVIEVGDYGSASYRIERTRELIDPSNSWRYNYDSNIRYDRKRKSRECRWDGTDSYKTLPTRSGEIGSITSRNRTLEMLSIDSTHSKPGALEGENLKFSDQEEVVLRSINKQPKRPGG